MSAFSAINLDRLPSPSVIEALDYESIIDEMLVDLRSRDPDYTAIVESDPAYKVLEVCAYRELLLRARVNDAARAVMLAYSSGSDLDHLAALFGVQRQLVDAGDPTAYPPVPPTYETDTRLRYRTQISLEAHTTAGSIGSYVFWGLTASPLVKDIDVSSPTPGHVVVTVLSTQGDGTPDQELLDLVYAALNAEDVRPLTDYLTMQAAAVSHYDLEAVLWMYDGPDPQVVRQVAEDAVTAYVTENHLLGHDITLSGLHAALHQPGVQRVEMVDPTGTLTVAPQEAAYCDSITVTVGGTDE